MESLEKHQCREDDRCVHNLVSRWLGGFLSKGEVMDLLAACLVIQYRLARSAHEGDAA